MPAPISDTHTIMDKLDRQSASAAIEPLLHYLPRENLQSIVYKVLATNPELIGTICEEYAKFNQWQYNGAILDVLPQCINSLLILERLVAAQTCKSWKEIIHLPISWAGGLHGVYVSNDWIATKAKYFGLF